MYLPRVAVIVLAVLAATAGLTFAAGGGGTPTAPPTTTSAPAPPPTVTVPDLENQAFVFAKQQLQDGGFAWRVTGSVQGYASNTVVSQSPAAGTKLIDTGTPLVTVTLARNGSYKQIGTPENDSPYSGTAVRLADAAVAPAAKLPKAPAAKLPKAQTATSAAPPTTTGATTTPAAPAPAPNAKTTPAKQAKAVLPQSRPPAFVVPGAKKEPLDEIPLTWRAQRLGTWIGAHPKPTNANVEYWLYQNEWVVSGATMGWWQGAEALRTLISVDARTQSVWGIGDKSEALARQALAEVEARSK